MIKLEIRDCIRQALIFSLATTGHLVEVPVPTLTLLTTRQAGTTTETPPPAHSRTEKLVIILLQTK